MMTSALYACAAVLLFSAGIVQSRLFSVERKPSHVRAMFRPNDKGVVKNCAPKGESKFTLMWDPKDLQAGITVKFYLDFTPEFDFAYGTVNITAWVSFIKDPIIQQTIDGKCTDIIKTLPTVSCPIRKGKKLRYWGFDYQIPAEVPIPPNNYRVRVEVLNDKKQMFICGEASTTFSDMDNAYQNDVNDFLRK